MEIDTPVRTVKVDYLCEVCHSGIMIYDKLRSQPYLNWHVCNECKKFAYLEKIYPYYKKKPIENPQPSCYISAEEKQNCPQCDLAGDCIA